MATVVVPYVHGMLDPRTAIAVQYSGFYCRFVDLDPRDHGAYGRLFRKLWRSQSTVVICEHDVVPTREQLRAIVTCGHDWCSYNYDSDMYSKGPMFGLVRFSGRLMAEHPEAANCATMVSRELGTERGWWDMDSHVARDLKIRGVEWHEHLPEVHHAHHGPPTEAPAG